MRRHDLILPELGMGDRPIRSSLWLVERGTRVIEGDPILEVLAGSAAVDLPAPVTGILVKKLVAEDEPLQVGQRLGIVEEEE
jgi:pyruvate/2-oxoglutarate dehydrogenase complex dihydrolipoamide acyltransferase (E2) component